MIDYSIQPSTKRIDHRGFLVDFLKGSEVTSNQRILGQIYFVTFDHKGVIRGNHYHTTKNEWFVVIRGKVHVVLENIETKERTNLLLDGDGADYQRIYVGKNTAHTFLNTTDTAEMINYADHPYHFDAPDTIPYILL